ncbi:MAG: hypothetical protein A2Y65_12745 [Deltaproteobacteria bacterium RBG_13_52_11]|nr:MAG: hypothetical protein A2Y65_12745 [Deltaproteobacteria bacterium RBG_13_52_11]
MERRRFIEGFFSALALGGLLLIGGCGKTEKPSGFGNQEKLWQLVSGQQKIEEPIDLVYSKKSPALYRDASMGKVDPSFVPKVSGG